MSETFPLEFVLKVKNEMSAGINQAKGEIQSLGTESEKTQQKATKSGMGIGAAFQFTALNAFNLATSLINTKRAYQDLQKAENTQLSKREAVTKATNRLQNAEITLFKARKSGDPARVAKAENMLENARLNVQRATRNEKQGQIDLNRSYEDFYLSIIPNVISGIGTAAGIMQVLQNTTVTAGGAITKFIIPLAAISAGFLALKTNFLGITDFFSNLGRDIGNAIPELKPFLSLVESIFATLGIGDKSKAKGLNNLAKQFMDSFGPVIDFFKNIIDNVMKGNWTGVFNTIKQAAMGFYKWLRGRIPFLADIEEFIQAIRNGNWDQVFSMIKIAAVNFWTWLKDKVPLLADIENFIIALSKADWSGVFNAVVTGWEHSGLPTLMPKIFGENWKADFDEWIVTVGASFGLLQSTIKNGDWKGAFGAIKQGAEQSGFQKVLDDLFKPNLALVVGWGADVINSMAAAINATATSLDSTDLPTSMNDMWNNLVNFIDWVTITGNMAYAFFAGLGMYLIEQFQGPIAKLVEAQINLSFAGTRMLAVMQNAGIALANALVIGLQKSNPILGAIANIIAIFDPELKKQIDAATSKMVFKPIPVPPPPTQAEIDKMTKEAMGDVDKALGKAKLNPVKIPFKAVVEVDYKSVLRRALVNVQANAGGIRLNAQGFHGWVSNPTMMMVGEKGSERVDVSRKGSSVPHGGGGAQPIIITLDGRVIAEVVANRMNQNQGVWK